MDPEAIYRQRVHGRRLVYLDTSLWGALADDTDAARTTLELCLRLVQNGIALFPGSHASIFETLQHPDDAHRCSQLRAMDRLGTLVSLRTTQEVEQEEARGVLPVLLGKALDAQVRHRVFTHVIGCVGGPTLSLPPGWPLASARWLQDRVQLELERYGLERLGRGMDLTRLRARHAAETAMRLADAKGQQAGRRNAAMFRRGDGKLDRARILEEEQAYLFGRARRHMLDALLETMPLTELLERSRPPPSNPLGVPGLFRLMPSLALRAEVFAQRVLGFDRKERPGDLYDNEHASVAPAYCDVFAAGDAGLVRLLRQCSVPRERACLILQGLPELHKHLNTWV